MMRSIPWLPPWTSHYLLNFHDHAITYFYTTRSIFCFYSARVYVNTIMYIMYKYQVCILNIEKDE